MTLIQYVIVRKDLMKKLKWNIGALIANACHAVSAVNEMSKTDEVTQKYLSPENLDKMHKCVLGIEDEGTLMELHQTLETAGIVHKMWIEMPENFPTCIALKPYDKIDVQNFFTNLKLLR